MYILYIYICYYYKILILNIHLIFSCLLKIRCEYLNRNLLRLYYYFTCIFYLYILKNPHKKLKCYFCMMQDF